MNYLLGVALLGLALAQNYSLASRLRRNRLIWTLLAIPMPVVSTLALLLIESNPRRPVSDQERTLGVKLAMGFLFVPMVAVVYLSGQLSLLREATVSGVAVDLTGGPGGSAPVSVEIGSSLDGLWTCRGIDRGEQPSFVHGDSNESWEFRCGSGPSWPDKVRQLGVRPGQTFPEESVRLSGGILIPRDARIGVYRGKLVGWVKLAKQRGGEFEAVSQRVSSPLISLQVVDSAALKNARHQERRNQLVGVYFLIAMVALVAVPVAVSGLKNANKP